MGKEVGENSSAANSATHYFQINKVWINMLAHNLMSFIFMFFSMEFSASAVNKHSEARLIVG